MLHLILAKRLRSYGRQILNHWTMRKVLSFLFSGIQSNHFMANRRGKSGSSDRFYFLGFQSYCNGDCNPEIKTLAPWRESYDKSRQCTKKQRHHFDDKGLYSQSYSFSSSHVWMWELVHKEGWAPKKWCFRIVVLEKTLESLLDCKEIKPVNPKGNQPGVFIRRTDAEVEVPILWPSDANSWHWKRPWCWEGLRTKEEGNREWDGWMASPIQWIWTWANSEMVRDREAWHAAVHEVTKSWTRLGF